MTPSALIREARSRSGLTLRQLAAAAGTSHSALAAYESRSKVPSAATLERILAAAGFSLDSSLAHRIRSRNGVERGIELVEVLDVSEQYPQFRFQPQPNTQPNAQPNAQPIVQPLPRADSGPDSDSDSTALRLPVFGR